MGKLGLGNFLLILCMLHMANCNKKVAILENKPVKNSKHSKCTVGIPIKSSSPLNEFSFCGKYRFKFLRESILMYMDGTESHLRLMNFEEKVGIIEHNLVGYFFYFQNQTMKPDSWQHICLSTSDDFITLVLNGEVVYNASPSKKPDKPKETNLWLGGENIQTRMYRRFEGTMTDIYLWNKALTMNELILITTRSTASESISIPALFSWKIFKPSAEVGSCVKYQILYDNDELFKEAFKEHDTLLIEYVTTSESSNYFCKSFGGKYVVPQHDNDIAKISSLIKNSAKCDRFAFVGLKKVDKQRLLDFEGNNASFVNWSTYEPNGKEYEECINIKENASYNDVSCFEKYCFACQMTARNIYSIRGGIPNDVDRKYIVSMTGEKTEIRGIKRTECYWNDTWQFGSDFKQDTPLADNMPPNGVHSWNNGQEFKFTQCNLDEFTCHSYGYCIPITERCDGEKDCLDGSDESKCAILTLQEGYDKKYPSSKNITVYISMDIYKILDVKELEMEYTIKLRLKLIWHDSRITFRNLKENKDSNQLGIKDIENIWSPKLLFHDSNQIGIVRAAAGNQESVDVSRFTGTGTVRILRNGHPQNNPLEELDEDYLYPGNENAVMMTNYMVVTLGCIINLHMYPFDSQTCPIKLIKPTDMGDMKLKWESVPRIFDEDLTQYRVFPTLQYANSTNQDKIKVNIHLQRKLSGHIFYTYIPTLCLITIAGFTLFIDFSHFEATIMVALTTMLVVYTLHQSISSTLPPTAYLKMIDIWLFGGLIVPFIIIVILILVDYLVMKETNQVIDIAKDNKNQWNSKSILTTMQIILPLLAGILMGSYWIIGLIHYFT